MTVGGVTTDALGANAALGIIVNGNIRMTETATDGSSLFFVNKDETYNAVSTFTDGVLGTTLSVTRDNWATHGFIYDSHYNQPPSSGGVGTLQQVLTAGSVALGTQNITVGGLVGNHAVDATHPVEYLAITSDTDFGNGNQYNIRSSEFVYITGPYKNTILTQNYGTGPDAKYFLSVTQDGTNYGAVYDSYYNRPPAAAASTLSEVLTAGNSANSGQVINLSQVGGVNPANDTFTQPYFGLDCDVDIGSKRLINASLVNTTTLGVTNIGSGAVGGTSVTFDDDVLLSGHKISGAESVGMTTGVNANVLSTSAPFSGANPQQLYITRGDGQYGAVYDSHYNQPTAAATPTLETVLTAGSTGPATIGMNVIGINGINPPDSLNPVIWLAVGTDTSFSGCGIRDIATGDIVSLSSDTIKSSSGGNITFSDSIELGVNNLTAATVNVGSIGSGVSGTDITFTSNLNMGGFAISNTPSFAVGSATVYNNFVTGEPGNPAQLTVTRDGVHFGAIYDSYYNQPTGGSGSVTQVIPDGSYPTVLAMQYATSGNQNLLGPFGSFDLGTENYNSFIVTFDSLWITSPIPQSGVANMVFTMYLSTSSTAYPITPLVNMIECSNITGTFDGNGAFQLNSSGILQSILPTSGASNTITLYIMATIGSSTLDNYNIELTITNFIITASKISTSAGAFIPQTAPS